MCRKYNMELEDNGGYFEVRRWTRGRRLGLAQTTYFLCGDSPDHTCAERSP